MDETPENPFASPVDVTLQEHHAFHAPDREAANRQNGQAIVAAILSILFGLATVQFTILVSLYATGAIITLSIMSFMTLSCIATTINHWHRAKRALQRLPLTIDEEGIKAKFEDSGTWTPRTIPWNEITNVRFVPRDRMVVTDTSGKESVADLSLMGTRRWGPLRKTLRYYSDWMAEARDKQR